MYQALLIRYGEISLKGKNRSFFVHKLIENIKNALKETGPFRIEQSYGRIYLYIEGRPDQYIEKLKLIPGIVSVSPVAITEVNLEKIKDLALGLFNYSVKSSPTSFLFLSKRSSFCITRSSCF